MKKIISNLIKTNNLKNLFAGCALVTDPGFSGPRFGNLVNYISCVISQSVIPLIFALAVVVFIWGVVQYLMGAEEEYKRAKGRQFMIWGIIALTVMVSVWGLVQIVG